MGLTCYNLLKGLPLGPIHANAVSLKWKSTAAVVQMRMYMMGLVM